MAARNRRPTTIDTIKDEAIEVKDKVKELLTVSWDDLPAWQQDNHYIVTGYRPASNSFQKSFGSLGYLHNESVNIYSHLLGGLGFTIIGLVLYNVLIPRYHTATKGDILSFGCFFAGAALCLGMSGTYHTISNHSQLVARFGNKLDYVGIVFLIAGSFVPSVFYGFYCQPHLQELYWTMICSIGLGCATMSIFDRFRTPEWRPYRAAMFVGMGMSALFPILHGVKMYGVHDMRQRVGLSWTVLQGILYILGAGLYAARWPERSSPGAYDIWGSSHQIFHILVVLAAASHLYGLLKAFDYHHSTLGLRC